ncbi:MAG: hypothetical protein ACOX1R_08640 [Caldicoprobacterales bacterium]|jgi:hypothetical protein
MIRFTKNKALIVILLTILMLTSGVGCNRILKRPKEQESKQSQEQKKSPPKILVSLENTTETMIKSIQEVMEKRAEAAKQEKPENQEKSSQEKANQGDKKEGDKSGGKEGDKSGDKEKQEEKKPEEGGGKDQQKQESKDKQAKTEPLDWKRMQKSVEKLQKSWSDYVNMALKDGASNELIKGYENQLDILTTKVMEEQEESLLNTANDLYKYYPKFFDLYKHKAPPNIKDMKYHIRKIIIDGEQSQWAETLKSMDAIKQAWDIAKSRMDKPDRDLNRRVETAIDSFSRSVKQQNTHLVKLKGNILMDMLEEIK